MEDKDFKDYVLISKKEYEKLIEIKAKYNQYKSFILKNTQNNKLISAITTIEGKNLYELLEEKKAKDIKEN